MELVCFLVWLSFFALAIRGIYDRLDKIISLLASRKEQP